METYLRLMAKLRAGRVSLSPDRCTKCSVMIGLFDVGVRLCIPCFEKIEHLPECKCKIVNGRLLNLDCHCNVIKRREEKDDIAQEYLIGGDRVEDDVEYACYTCGTSMGCTETCDIDRFEWLKTREYEWIPDDGCSRHQRETLCNKCRQKTRCTKCSKDTFRCCGSQWEELKCSLETCSVPIGGSHLTTITHKCEAVDCKKGSRFLVCCDHKLDHTSVYSEHWGRRREVTREDKKARERYIPHKIPWELNEWIAMYTRSVILYKASSCLVCKKKLCAAHSVRCLFCSNHYCKDHCTLNWIGDRSLEQYTTNCDSCVLYIRVCLDPIVTVLQNIVISYLM